jgi:mannosyltransferase
MSATLAPDPAPRLSEPAGAARLEPVDAAIVAGAALLAAGLSLISLTTRSLGFDEGATVAIVSQHGAALWRGIAHDGGNMAGYYLLLHVLVGAFGDGPWVLRLPSVVFAGLTAGCVGAISLALWRDRRAAGIAALLCAVSLPLVYWGQTARGYAGMVCFACLAMLALVALVRAEQEGTPAIRPAVAYVVAMTCAAYCGFIVLLIVPAHVLVLVGRRGALARLVGGLVVLAVLCIPIVVLATGRGSGQLFWVPRPGHQVETQVMQTLTSAGLQSTFHRSFTTTAGWIITSVVLLCLIAYAVRARVRDRHAGDRLAGFGCAMVLGWIVVPGLIAFLGSLVVQPVFIPRNVLLSTPAVALGLGLILADRRLPRWLAIAGVGGALFIRAVPVVGGYGVSPEPWRQVSARVLAAARPGDCVAFYPEDGRNAFRYYVARAGARARAPHAVLPAIGWSTTTPYVEIYATLSRAQIGALRSRCTRLWFVSSHEGQQNGPPAARRHRVRWLALQRRLRRVFGSGPVRTSGWASAIHVELMPGRSRRP